MTRLTPRYPQKHTGETLTEQHHKDSCDVNNIIKRYEATGLIENMQTRTPRWEYASAQTFDEAARIVASANTQFEELPAHIRKKFGNSTETFLDALQDPEQLKTMQDLGFLPETPEIAPEHAERVDSTPPIKEETPPKRDSPLD